VSNVSRARWLMDNGPFLTAEDTLWREHLRRPDSALTWWALRDLYSRHPSLVSLATDNRNGRALAMSMDGTLAAVGDADRQGGQACFGGRLRPHRPGGVQAGADPRHAPRSARRNCSENTNQANHGYRSMKTNHTFAIFEGVPQAVAKSSSMGA